MQMDGDLDRRFDPAYEMIGVEWSQESGHVFDAECIGSQILQCFGHVDKTVHAVDGANRIADGGFDMFAAGFHLSHGSFDVADIVQCVEDTKDVDAVRGGPRSEEHTS